MAAALRMAQAVTHARSGTDGGGSERLALAQAFEFRARVGTARVERHSRLRPPLSPLPPPAMSSRPPFTSKTAWDALGVESAGEESEEEVLTDSGAQAEVDRYDAMLSSSVTRSSDVVQRVRVDSQAVQERNQEAKGVGPC